MALVCEICKKEICNCGSADATLTEEDVKKFKEKLWSVKKPIDHTKTVKDAGKQD